MTPIVRKNRVLYCRCLLYCFTFAYWAKITTFSFCAQVWLRYTFVIRTAYKKKQLFSRLQKRLLNYIVTNSINERNFDFVVAAMRINLSLIAAFLSKFCKGLCLCGRISAILCLNYRHPFGILNFSVFFYVKIFSCLFWLWKSQYNNEKSKKKSPSVFTACVYHIFCGIPFFDEALGWN